MDIASAFDGVPAGRLTAPNGAVFVRRRSRVKRSLVDAWIADGAPLVTWWYGGGECEWFAGEPARAAWADRRPLFTSNAPQPTPRSMTWTAQEWADGSGTRLVVLEGHC